ncbi:ketosteroid isomerase [Helicobacter pullorum]|uniref:Ketosteroid isomerase n=1 Tax=Helicobacter pullorum TaxID=35818 RepID=A0A0N1EL97_9HELI|nr:nuclear transport factor 2 family protein [Helicobacter pullorum]KPH55980.1 ketosteroid isomerase [Helicobacter pullorum]OCR18778.1 ketosteroid isomerase [Helicobacter pullorum]
MLKKLTQQYIEAFNDRNLEGVANLLDENFALEDPVIKRLEGKDKCLESISNIFNSCKTLSFGAKNIYQDLDTTFIEFSLTIDNTILKGIDVICWQGNKIKEMRAYVYEIQK